MDGTMIAVLPRILGALFYYSPKHDAIQALIPQLSSFEILYEWQDKSTISALCPQLTVTDLDVLTYQFSVLFEGQGAMVAPPWGAVYLNKDNLVMSDFTIAYRQFLSQHALTLSSPINEPDDQFGLMLLALASLLESNNHDAVKTLLEHYLLPWAFRYLSHLQNNSVSTFYAALAKITEYFLKEIQHDNALMPVNLQLYF